MAHWFNRQMAAGMLATSVLALLALAPYANGVATSIGTSVSNALVKAILVHYEDPSECACSYLEDALTGISTSPGYTPGDGRYS